MPALSGGAVTTWRTGKPYSVQGYVFILKPTVVFQARVNMASVTYPLTAITFDTVTTGAYTDISIGMTLFLGSSAGASDLGKQRIRAAASSTVIQVGRTSKGIHWGELDVFDNVFITVVDLREVWAKIPFINASGVSLKDQTSFAANIAQPPVANGGCAVADFVDPDTDELVVDFSGSNSFIVDPGASSLTHSWNFADGTPSTSTSATPTGVTFPAGFRYVRYTVSDGTRTHTTWIPVYAAARTGEDAPIPVEVSTRTLKPEGQRFSFTLRAQDLPVDEYPNGTLVIYFEEERYGLTAPESLAGPTGREKVKFVGWLDTEQTQIEAAEDGLAKAVSMTALDVAARLAKLPGFGQIVKRKTSPTTWQQMKSANLNRYLHHLLHWHSTALEVAPFSWANGGSAYEFISLESDAQNLYGQVDQLALAIAYKFTCSQRGELGIKADPQRLAAANRTTTVIVDLVATDWSRLELPETPPPTIHWLRSSAVLAHATQTKAFFAIAPGQTPGQGESSREIGQQLVIDQTELNTRAGHDYARLNAQQGIIDLTLAHGGDAGIDPSLMEWVTLELPAALAAQRGATIPTATRYLPLEASVAINHRDNTHDVSLRREREVEGYTALTVVQKAPTQISPSIPNYPLGPTYGGFPPNPEIVVPPYPLIPGNPAQGLQMPIDGNAILTYSQNGLFVTSAFRRSDSPEWSDVTPSDIEGIIAHAMFGPFGHDAYLIAGGSEAWCYEFDFEITNGWSTRSVFSGTPGTYSGGTGWTHGNFRSSSVSAFYRGVEIEKTFSASTITSIELEFDLTKGSYVSSSDYGVVRIESPGGVVKTQILRTASVSGSAQTLTWSGLMAGATNIILYVHSSVQGSASYSGSATIKKVTIRGTGANPFGVSNCTEIEDASVWYSPDLFASTPTWVRGDVVGAGYNLLRTVYADGILYAYAPGVAETKYSTDHAETWAAARSVGTSPGSYGGFDTGKGVSNVVLAAADGQTKKASAGSVYASYGGAKEQGAYFIPRYALGSTSSNNTGSNPEYVLVASALDGGESMWKVTASGATFTAITPVISTHKGLAVSPNCIVMPWRSGARIAAILNFNGTRRLVTTINTGTGWTDRGALGAGADSIKMRRSDRRVQELYWVDSVPKFSPDFGATIRTKDSPTDDDLIGIDVYG